jgi:very-short-patch-repair endonuclease
MHRVKPNQKAFATSLRNSPTDAERALWESLRGDLLNGLRFRRQFPIGIYIVDFVCFETRLIVEVDGGQHAESKHDETRDIWLKSEGFQVLRFWNNEVLQNMEGVMQVIAETINFREQVLPPPPKATKEPFQVSGEGRGEVKAPNANHSPATRSSPAQTAPKHRDGT